MPLTLLDMSLVRHAQALTSLSVGTQTLIANIIAQTDTSDIATPGGKGNKKAFFNHGYDKDPATNGGKLGLGATVSIYYMPANKKEYDDYEVIDKAVGMLSGRRRLAVRTENDKTSFYTTGHPKNEAIRSNTYTGFVPIDPKR